MHKSVYKYSFQLRHGVAKAKHSGKKPSVFPKVYTAAGKPVYCSMFPRCRFRAVCAYQHPRCKYGAACIRPRCMYEHGTPAAQSAPPAQAPSSMDMDEASPQPSPPLSPPATPKPTLSYKAIAAPTPGMCKYYPSCSNPTCGFFHPKACRYGAACLNKLECNFYHADLPPSHWRHPA
ncbi:zinc finger CCCH domain-containing protein 14-like [Ostrinia furnacalis]|uniref:zinc finger CCCH domain-containing protein 14-like n=1 Tax=Ostrinia furnacalis TaxID=93504 RepID=UPI00103F5F97|nr:zinc finger CCCH domain-containing protein 14-like [Ostrinia furnacalis]